MNATPTLDISLVAMMNNDKVLLLKRGSNVHCPNVWSFPGGKAQTKESPLQTAVRELQEETALVGNLWRHIGNHQHQYDAQKLCFSFFLCHDDGQSLVQAESEYQWFKLKHLPTLNMPEANQALISMLLNHENTI